MIPGCIQIQNPQQNMAVLIERLTDMADMTIFPEFCVFYHTLLVCNCCGKNKVQVQALSF